MTRSSTRRAVASVGFTLMITTLLLGCPKKPPPAVVDAGEPPPPASTTVTELAPLTEDDAGDGGDAGEGGAKHWTGTGTASNPNQLKIAACCAAMRSQAKQMGASPEAFQLNAMALQCDTFAKQVGPTGNAPELNQARAVLRSIKLPKGCEF